MKVLYLLYIVKEAHGELGQYITVGIGWTFIFVSVPQKKKFVVKIYEKYADQKKHQMVTYIIGKAYDEKFASNKNSRPPPPPRYLMVRPLHLFTIPFISSIDGSKDLYLTVPRYPVSCSTS